MIDRFLTIGAVGFAEVLCAVAGPASALAQQTQDTVFYQNGAEQVALAIHLDSMGIQAAPRATEQMITAYFDKLGLTVRRLGPGTYALGLLQPARDKQDLFDRGRDFYLNRPDLFENAGPLARFLGADEAIVLTDQFIVMYHANAPVEVVDSMVTAWRVELLITAPTEPELRLYRVTPNSPGGLMEATAAFQNSPLTKWAYPDFLDGADPAGSDPAEPLPVDPLVANQWHLENSSGADIGATQAWAITTGEPGVVIAVLDNGGFDVDHPDLRPNLWRNEVEITGDSGLPVITDTNGLLEAIGFYERSFTNELVTAQDAEYTLDGFVFTSASNSITDTVPGVTITLLKADAATPETATLTLSKDDAAIKTSFESLMKTYNDIVSFIR
ncbi:MAG: flagellar filament capping protein FliD [Chloroflexi bacterium]|nr:flagellar filament capping protein FliD [Chloroflexota bacterium]